MEKNCDKCGKLHDQDDLFTFNVEGKWFLCSAECALTFDNEELREIYARRSKKLKSFLEGDA